jgi:hypothetical protein
MSRDLESSGVYANLLNNTVKTDVNHQGALPSPNSSLWRILIKNIPRKKTIA